MAEDRMHHIRPISSHMDFSQDEGSGQLSFGTQCTVYAILWSINLYVVRCMDNASCNVPCAVATPEIFVWGL